MKFTLEVELGNDAIQTFNDVLDAMQRCADVIDDTRILNSGDARKLRDENGNQVGQWEVEE